MQFTVCKEQAKCVTNKKQKCKKMFCDPKIMFIYYKNYNSK